MNSLIMASTCAIAGLSSGASAVHSMPIFTIPIVPPPPPPPPRRLRRRPRSCDPSPPPGPPSRSCTRPTPASPSRRRRRPAPAPALRTRASRARRGRRRRRARRPAQEQVRREPGGLREDGLLDVGGVAHEPALGHARAAALIQEDVGRLHVRVHQRRPHREHVDVVQALRRADQDALPRRPVQAPRATTGNKNE
ncbi:hypothetical protein PVAP13_2NG552006 [Panicum virgatum]|uniref:Uncharacterized protein n=1 Tax=Panicum virgatum TaxID=38727 RepID=A0A8T0VTX7_PANVG|nr:hypothetical protein PVAP13_2NG552006 [Panicum virgatum]